MFDPSKMDLDLENLDNIEINNKKYISEVKTDTLNDENNQKQIKENSQEIIEQTKKIKEIPLNIPNNNLKKEKIIFDININSIEYLIKYLISKNYDFFTLEPEDDKVKIGFRKNNIEKEIKYIKYPIYLNILLKAKALTKLKIEDTNNSQEGKTEINFNKKVYKILSKTSPSNFGEKLFFKIIETEKKQAPKKKEKMSLGKIMGIFGGLLFTAIIIGGVFLAIILFNSNSVSDLQFFNNLGINTNAIKEFAGKLVNGIFGFILLIEIIFLFVFSYKALLTKKEFKQKKVSRIIISIFFLILSAITLITWMFLAQKINSLKGLNYGKIEFYDNSKFISRLFTPKDSKIDINENIIGPITIRFNNKEFIQKLIDDGFKPKKVIWKIGKEQIEKPIGDYELIYNFTKKGLNEVKLIVEGINIKGEEDSKEKEVGKINLNNIINIKEIKLDNGGSKFIFDANNLKYLGKIYWYYIPSLKGKTENETNTIIAKALKKEKLIGYKFNSKNIFESEEYYAIKIISGNKTNEEIQNIPLDKIFVISKDNKTKISGQIKEKQNIDNENKYSFILKNPENNIGEAYIKEFIWEIQDYNDKNEEKIIKLKKEANLSDLENSSKINYEFKKAGKHIINLKIIDSDGKEHKVQSKTININKKLKLISTLNFSINNKTLEKKKDYNYESNNNIYYLEDIASPSILNIDSTKIKTLNRKYLLSEVLWDLNNDGNFEKTGRKISYNINTEGISSIKVKYIFKNLNIKNEIIETIETININSIKKEAILDLKILKKSSYVPTIIQFDATSSSITGKNIDKFIFDYGDGTPPEERDGKNTGHKYIESGNYTIKLTAIATTGEKYSISKKLILKNKPQSAKIKLSLKKAPSYQAIDFSAEESIGEVATYLWDFGDGTTSTELSPSHFYKKTGKYKVKLNLEFTNRNTLNDEIEIEIYDE